MMVQLTLGKKRLINLDFGLMVSSGKDVPGFQFQLNKSFLHG